MGRVKTLRRARWARWARFDRALGRGWRGLIPRGPGLRVGGSRVGAGRSWFAAEDRVTAGRLNSRYYAPARLKKKEKSSHETNLNRLTSETHTYGDFLSFSFFGSEVAEITELFLSLSGLVIFSFWGKGVGIFNASPRPRLWLFLSFSEQCSGPAGSPRNALSEKAIKIFHKKKKK